MDFVKTTSLLLLTAAFGNPALASEEQISPRTGAPLDWGEPLKDDQNYAMILIDRLEAGFAGEEDTNVWDAQAWYGGDYNKLWLKTEGEGAQGKPLEEAELQALYSRTVSPFWDFQVGGRYDFRPEPERSFFVIGFQGLAEYKFEVDSSLFVSDEGDTSFRFEAEYDVLFTQRLILQPRFELNAAFSDTPEYGLASGINNTELGLRLRYEIRREFAPYVGISWTQQYAGTADLARDEGESTSTKALVVGLRAWF